MTSPMDEALRRTNEAVERYKVSQRLIEAAAWALKHMAPDARHETGIHALVDAVVRIGADHGGPHESCLTCLSVRNAVAVSMGVVRAEADLALARMIGE